MSATSPAYCWGFNHEGELGDGRTLDKHAPVLVAGSPTVCWTQVSPGDKHTCGLRSDDGGNLLYCWGSNELGQLGNGSLRSRAEPVRVVQ